MREATRGIGERRGRNDHNRRRFDCTHPRDAVINLTESVRTKKICEPVAGEEDRESADRTEAAAYCWRDQVVHGRGELATART
jgi:hypothetical protein